MIIKYFNFWIWMQIWIHSQTYEADMNFFCTMAQESSWIFMREMLLNWPVNVRGTWLRINIHEYSAKKDIWEADRRKPSLGYLRTENEMMCLVIPQQQLVHVAACYISTSQHTLSFFVEIRMLKCSECCTQSHLFRCKFDQRPFISLRPKKQKKKKTATITIMSLLLSMRYWI